MNKEEILNLRKTAHYEVSDGLSTNDALFNGIILKSFYKHSASIKNQCYLIDETTKTRHHIESKPEGFINRTQGITLCFTELTEVHKLIPTVVHYTIHKFDEPRTLAQITNEIII